VLARQDLVGRADDRVGELGIEAAGLLVGESGGFLDPDDGVDEGASGRRWRWGS